MDNRVEDYKLTPEMKRFAKGHRKLMQARQLVESRAMAAAIDAMSWQDALRNLDGRMVQLLESMPQEQAHELEGM